MSPDVISGLSGADEGEEGAESGYLLLSHHGGFLHIEQKTGVLRQRPTPVPTADTLPLRLTRRPRLERLVDLLPPALAAPYGEVLASFGFFVHEERTGLVANGLFLSAEPDGRVLARAEILGPWEDWEVLEVAEARRLEWVRGRSWHLGDEIVPAESLILAAGPVLVFGPHRLPLRGLRLSAALAPDGRLDLSAFGETRPALPLSPSPHSPAEKSSPSMRAQLIQRIYRGRDPFESFPAGPYALDLQGWHSEHPYLTEAIDQLRPSLVAEIGVWKGGSTLTMARRIRELGLDGVVIAIDTWLGAWNHWEEDEWFFSTLALDHGYPMLVRTFMTNVIKLGMTDQVVPLPLDSLNAARVLRDFGFRPQVIHIDGAHDYESVSADLRVWWELLTPGGILIGDDYFTEGHWPEVRQAFDDFFGARGLTPFEFGGGKCRIRKPPA